MSRHFRGRGTPKPPPLPGTVPPTRSTRVLKGHFAPMQKKGEDDFNPAYLEYAKRMDICFKLTAIARSILHKPFLRLQVGTDMPRAATDGKTIWLPRKHPNILIATKHELSHIYFKSNLALRLLFVRQLLEELEKETGVPLQGRLELIDQMCLFINVLDDTRVNSLWGLLYPGDGEDMEEWYYGTIGPQQAEIAKGIYGDDIDNLFAYAVLLTLRQDPQSTKWGPYKDDILQAVDDSYFKSFPAMLVVARRTLRKILRGISASIQPPDPTPPMWGGNPNPLDKDDEEAQQALKAEGDGEVTPEGDLDKLMTGRMQQSQKEEQEQQTEISPDALRKLLNNPLPDSFDNPESGFDHQFIPSDDDMQDLATLRALAQASGVDADDQDAMTAFLGNAEEEGVAAVQFLQQAMNNHSGAIMAGNFRNENGFVTKDVKADVNLVRPSPFDITPYVLSPADLEAADRWKKHFLRVLGVLSSRTDEYGHEIIPELYIRQKLSHEPFRCFRRDSSARGFRLTILADMSGSMYGSFDMVERLVGVLQRALDFSFVHLDVGGFNSSEGGTVNYYKYPPRTKGLISPKSRVSGVTPLSHAIQIAGRGLIGTRDESHLFVLSDGFPVYQIKSGWAPKTSVLVNWARDAVLQLKRQHVNVWCWMIGTHSPGSEDLDRMFGPHAWKKIDRNRIYEDSFEFITKQFLNFMRRR